MQIVRGPNTMMLKINKSAITTLACSADIRFYMQNFNYCNNGGGCITALTLAFDEWTSGKRMRCSKTPQNWRYIWLQFCIPMIWNCFHQRHFGSLCNWQNTRMQFRAGNLFLHHGAVCLGDGEGMKNRRGRKSAIHSGFSWSEKK